MGFSEELERALSKLSPEELERVFYKLTTESWNELGIVDPGISGNMKYTDDEIIAKAPRPYGFGYQDNYKKWDAMRRHPLYIEQVRMSLSRILDQIARIKNNEKPKIDFASLPDSFYNAMDIGNEIAKDIGWGDPRDIVIAIQQHPLSSQLLRTREQLKAKK